MRPLLALPPPSLPWDAFPEVKAAPQVCLPVVMSFKKHTLSEDRNTSASVFFIVCVVLPKLGGGGRGDSLVQQQVVSSPVMGSKPTS